VLGTSSIMSFRLQASSPTL